MEHVRERLERERQELIDQLRVIGMMPDVGTRSATGSLFEEGDQAQASERQDVEFAVRERTAARINRLTAALERLYVGTYGTCERCGEPIERVRLTALPEAETCLRCQEQIERAA